MSLEHRGTRVVYTRSRRVGGRIVRKYVGSGRFAELMAELDALDREERRLAREQEQRDRDEIDRLDELLDGLDAAIETLARAVLLCSGCHLHKRGTWRRRRESKTKTEKHSDCEVGGKDIA